MRSASGVAKKASLSFSAALVHFFVFSPSPPLPVSATAVAVASAIASIAASVLIFIS